MGNTLVVLAAGIGSRYGGLKQMDPIGPSGEFLLDYSVYDAIRAGFTKVVFVIRRDIEDDFRALVGSRIEPRIETVYVNQDLADLPPGFSVPPGRQKPWGTGHAVLACREVVDTPFAVINADDFYGQQAYHVLCDFMSASANDTDAYAMVGYRLLNTLSDHGSVARGICRTAESGLLQTVVERTRIEKTEDGARCLHDDNRWEPLTGEEIVSMNLWGFKPSLFQELQARFACFLETASGNPTPEFFVPTVVNKMIAANLASVRVLQSESAWFGVTYPEDKPIVIDAIRTRVQAGEYPGDLWGRRTAR